MICIIASVLEFCCSAKDSFIVPSNFSLFVDLPFFKKRKTSIEGISKDVCYGYNITIYLAIIYDISKCDNTLERHLSCSYNSHVKYTAA